MNDMAKAGPLAIAGGLTVLCVDDEVNILNALRRLLRPQGYRVLTAGSGAEGLAMLEQTPVDLVLSDMRMPEMDGARFLTEVRKRWPDTARILLTGHADLSSTVAAINKAEIYRYIAKPWDDAVVLGVLRDALERKMLERERARLERLTARQNEELKELNATLEVRVKARTAELNEALSAVEAAHGKLKKSFVTSITVFANLIELHESARAGHSRVVADTARRLALQMGLGDAKVQDVMLAGLLHGIGEFGFSDAVLRKPLEELTPEARAEVMKHPLKAQAALTALDQLTAAGEIIRSHRERYDGSGYPDRLAGEAIPIGARVLAVAHDYEAAQEGTLTGRWLSKLEARAYIVAARGSRYDPTVVDVFVRILDAAGVTAVRERVMCAAELKEGAVLSRDLITADGILLLSKGMVLDAVRIERLRGYESRDRTAMKVPVREGGA